MTSVDLTAEQQQLVGLLQARFPESIPSPVASVTFTAGQPCEVEIQLVTPEQMMYWRGSGQAPKIPSGALPNPVVTKSPKYTWEQIMQMAPLKFEWLQHGGSIVAWWVKDKEGGFLAAFGGSGVPDVPDYEGTSFTFT